MSIVGPERPPAVKYKNLEEVVTAKIRYNLVHFDVRVNSVRITQATDWVPFTIQLKKSDVVWIEEAGVHRMHLRLFGRFLTLTNRVAMTVEEEIRQSDNDPQSPQLPKDILQFSRSVPLRAGRYRFDLAVQDVNADRIGTWSGGVVLREHPAGELAISPLFIADAIDLPVRRYLYPISGDFYVGDIRIHPRFAGSSDVPSVFHSSETLNLFLQAYNLVADPRGRQSDVVLDYDITNTPTKRIAVHLRETSADLLQFGEQITLRKAIPLSGLPAGTYQVCVKVTDQVSHRSVVSGAPILIQ